MAHPDPLVVTKGSIRSVERSRSIKWEQASRPHPLALRARNPPTDRLPPATEQRPQRPRDSNGGLLKADSRAGITAANLPKGRRVGKAATARRPPEVTARRPPEVTARRPPEVTALPKVGATVLPKVEAMVLRQARKEATGRKVATARAVTVSKQAAR
jgi:hypothetical protein